MEEREFEQAARIEMEMRSIGIEMARRRQSDFFPWWDGVHCWECGEELPPERAAAGRVFCVEDQERRERQGFKP